MKDQHAIVTLSIVLAIMVNLTAEIPRFQSYTVFAIPSMMTILACVLLTVIQRKNQKTFFQHLKRTFKVISLSLILYLPICLLIAVLLSLRFIGNGLQDSFNHFATLLPRILGATLLVVIMTLLSLVFVAMMSYLFGKTRKL